MGTMPSLLKAIDQPSKLMKLAYPEAAIGGRRVMLRVVRRLPPDAGVGQRADLVGQASDKPRGRKPRIQGALVNGRPVAMGIGTQEQRQGVTRNALNLALKALL